MCPSSLRPPPALPFFLQHGHHPTYCTTARSSFGASLGFCLSVHEGLGFSSFGLPFPGYLGAADAEGGSQSYVS